METPLTFLCIASYFKGVDFIKSLKNCGARVFVITSSKLKDEPWPLESIDEMFFVHQDSDNHWNMEHVILGLAHTMRSKKVDRIVALDDFDVEKGAMLREEFRIPGMGQTTYRFFRDKLAMRQQAKDEGLPVPAFTSLFHDEDVKRFTETIPAPWVLKPRSEASAAGIKKLHSADELWERIEGLKDKRHRFLVEQFRPGDVYHVDSLTMDQKVVFSQASKYLAAPLDVSQGGGIFRSVTLSAGSKQEKALQKLNAAVLKAFRLNYSASHTEIIHCREDDKLYFLETASRVGGAHIADMVEKSTGVNLWTEWAKLEYAMASKTGYTPPKSKFEPTGLIISLCRYEEPDYNMFQDDEIVWKLRMKNHIGLIVRSKDQAKVADLLEDYAHKIATHYHTAAPPRERINE